MFDIKWIRDNPAAFDAGLKRRGLAPLSAVILTLDEERRAHLTTLQEAQARRNAASKEIGKAKGAKDEALAGELMAEVAALKEPLAKGEEEEREIDAEIARRCWRSSPTCRSTTCRTARTRRTTRRCAGSARRRSSTSSRSSTSRSARRWA